MKVEIKPGMTLKFDKGYDVKAFTDRINDEVYCNASVLSTRSVIVVEQVASPFKYIDGVYEGLKLDLSYAPESNFSLWACLSNGKLVWISNLDLLGSIVTITGRDDK